MVCPRQKNVFRSMDFRHLSQHVEMAIHIRHAQKILAGGNQSFPLASNWQANHSMAASPAIQDIQPENVDVPYTPQFFDGDLSEDDAIRCAEDCCMEDTPVPLSGLWHFKCDQEYKLDGNLFEPIQSVDDETCWLFPELPILVNKEILDSLSESDFGIELPGRWSLFTFSSAE